MLIVWSRFEKEELAFICLTNVFPHFQMISAEAPMLFDRGCEIFITELTLRAW